MEGKMEVKCPQTWRLGNLWNESIQAAAPDPKVQTRRHFQGRFLCVTDLSLF